MTDNTGQAVRDALNSVDGDWEWLCNQLEQWPKRVHPDRTTSDGYLRESAAKLIRAALANLAPEAVGVTMCKDDGGLADTFRAALAPFAEIANRKASLVLRPDDPIVKRAQRLIERTTAPASLLEPVTAKVPAGCHCTTICAAPIMMGRQQPCRRAGGVPGQPAPSKPAHPAQPPTDAEAMREANIGELKWAAEMLARKPWECSLGVASATKAQKRCEHCTNSSMECFTIGRVQDALLPFHAESTSGVSIRALPITKGEG